MGKREIMITDKTIAILYNVQIQFPTFRHQRKLLDFVHEFAGFCADYDFYVSTSMIENAYFDERYTKFLVFSITLESRDENIKKQFKTLANRYFNMKKLENNIESFQLIEKSTLYLSWVDEEPKVSDEKTSRGNLQIMLQL